MRRRALLAALAALTPAPAAFGQAAVPPELQGVLEGARLLGSGRLRFMGLHIYDARLWAGPQAPGADWAAAPFALELVYGRSLSGERIAERSLTEMKRQGDIAEPVAARWLARMKTLFPDVKEGDRITGLNLPGSGARFFVNGAPRGDERDAEFARLFFGIWLSPRTSEPALREALLGVKAP